jgi:dipeptidyl aminopeptidase/acylaminoacyl peptidase
MDNGQEIHFRNEIQRLDLAGLLFVPKGAGPYPGVVFIHGSGASRRDNRWYLTLVHYLQENGVAVLLPDKRGSEKSQGDWKTSSFEELATDTISAVKYLGKQASIRVSPIGIVGISQGGWIAPIAADGSTDISYIVDVVGTSVTAHEQLLFEEKNNLREMGFPPAAANMAAPMTTFILRKISQRSFWKATGNFDPLPYWRKIEIPALVLYGSEDTNLPSQESRERFESLNKGNIIVKVYEGSGHALQDPPGKGSDIFRKDALEEIVRFIRSVVSSL